jgi:hypothetical protein
VPRIPDVHIDLENLNHSELVLLAKWCELPASRAMPREKLIDSLETFKPVEGAVPFQDLAETLSTWLLRWWDRVRMQAAKKVCPKCHKCRDMQVLDCYTRNRANINPKRPRR